LERVSKPRMMMIALPLTSFLMNSVMRMIPPTLNSSACGAAPGSVACSKGEGAGARRDKRGFQRGTGTGTGVPGDKEGGAWRNEARLAPGGAGASLAGIRAGHAEGVQGRSGSSPAPDGSVAWRACSRRCGCRQRAGCGTWPAARAAPGRGGRGCLHERTGPAAGHASRSSLVSAIFGFLIDVNV